MSYQLVIAEKPSVARSIAGVIGADKKQDGYMEGNGYLVSWCIGHLVSLADAGTYDERFKKWRYDDLPILPQEWQYIIPDDKKKQFDTLRSLMERPDVMTTSLPSIFCAARHAFRPLAVRESTETSTCSLPPFSWGCVLVLY